MGAMTMPYPVVDDATLDKLTPGDQITADVVVVGDPAVIHLENVVVVKKGDGKKTPSGLALPPSLEGSQVPNFAFVNQDGARIGLHKYAGKALLVTFIYTRCPLEDYCPLMTHNFAQVEKTLAQTPALYAKTLDALGAMTTTRRLGWRFWYGNPFAATTLVTASKPFPRS